jgi:hypothetical protein
MAWSTRSFWAGVGVTFVAFFLVKAAWPIFLDVVGGNDYKVDRELASPSRTYRAVLYTGMGGGAAGWCAQYVAIALANTPFSPQSATETYSYVFSGRCSSDIAFEWATDNRLRVAYSIGEGTTVTQKPRTNDGAVTVEYKLLQ